MLADKRTRAHQGWCVISGVLVTIGYLALEEAEVMGKPQVWVTIVLLCKYLPLNFKFLVVIFQKM